MIRQFLKKILGRIIKPTVEKEVRTEFADGTVIVRKYLNGELVMSTRTNRNQLDKPL